MLNVDVLSVFMLSVTRVCVCVCVCVCVLSKHRISQCRLAECSYAECPGVHCITSADYSSKKFYSTGPSRAQLGIQSMLIIGFKLQEKQEKAQFNK
jgi:hypothetical protein